MQRRVSHPLGQMKHVHTAPWPQVVVAAAWPQAVLAADWCCSVVNVSSFRADSATDFGSSFFGMVGRVSPALQFAPRPAFRCL